MKFYEEMDDMEEFETEELETEDLGGKNGELTMELYNSSLDYTMALAVAYYYLKTGDEIVNTPAQGDKIVNYINKINTRKGSHLDDLYICCPEFREIVKKFEAAYEPEDVRTICHEVFEDLSKFARKKGFSNILDLCIAENVDYDRFFAYKLDKKDVEEILDCISSL